MSSTAEILQYSNMPPPGTTNQIIVPSCDGDKDPVLPLGSARLLLLSLGAHLIIIRKQLSLQEANAELLC